MVIHYKAQTPTAEALTELGLARLAALPFDAAEHDAAVPRRDGADSVAAEIDAEIKQLSGAGVISTGTGCLPSRAAPGAGTFSTPNYVAGLRRRHGRKTGFWSRLDSIEWESPPIDALYA